MAEVLVFAVAVLEPAAAGAGAAPGFDEPGGEEEEAEGGEEEFHAGGSSRSFMFTALLWTMTILALEKIFSA
jgi:hypothetical protein